MNAYHITGTEGLASLTLVQTAAPAPKPGEVLVRLRAISLNYRDYMNVTGLHGISGPVPRIPCSDGAGEVEAVGFGVTAWKPGDRVLIPFMPSWLEGPFRETHAAQALGGVCDGLLREKVCVRAESLVRLPGLYSFEEGATLPCAAVTAWDALHVRGEVKAGETVLIQGTGGVSIFALQFARLAGARVLAITSSQEKATRLLQLGAEKVHNYREDPAWDVWALAQTERLGVDKVIEIGGPQTLNRSIQAARFGSHIALIGVLTGTAGEVRTAALLRKGIRLDGVYVGSRAMLVEMLDVMAEARLRPVIDSVFEFDQAIEAFRRLESGAHFGKIVIHV